MSYKSSSMTFLYKYVLPIFWIVGMFAFIFLIPPVEGQGLPVFFKYSMGLVIIIGGTWLVYMAIKLQRVEANETSFNIKTFRGVKSVDYENIVWVSQLGSTNPAIIRVKYKETNTLDTKMILIMPSTTSEMFRFKFFEDHDMTTFIREQIRSANPDYSEKSEPSKWLPIILVFGTLILSQILVLVFA